MSGANRYPIKDQVAIVGVGSTGYARTQPDRSLLSLVIEASIAAIRDAGLTAADIDGVCTVAPYVPGWFGVAPQRLSAALGLPEVNYQSTELPPIGHTLGNAVNAVFAGACRHALVVNGIYRSAAISRSAAADPIRRRVGEYEDPGVGLGDRVDFAAYAREYFDRVGAQRRHLGLIAVNGRTGAEDNELAVLRTPLDLDTYLAARMIRDPMCLYDCDVPVDGADAFIVTTSDRARDLPHPPALVHALTVANVRHEVTQGRKDLLHSGQHVAAAALRQRSDLWIDDMDVYFPYDGFSVITMASFEAMGFCEPGEVPEFLEQCWSPQQRRLLIDGRVRVNPHGGALSEGGTQGAGHVREAVMQLRNAAGPRQVPDARVAILNPGGMFHNPQGMVLRNES
jgi:acetyl-CoA acetyltransferase